jgi:hypothetical protein
MTNKLVRGLQDDPNSRNEHYHILGRGVVPRRNAVAIKKRGGLPGVEIITRNGREYLRDIPDRSTRDNINQKKKRR